MVSVCYLDSKVMARNSISTVDSSAISGCHVTRVVSVVSKAILIHESISDSILFTLRNM